MWKKCELASYVYTRQAEILTQYLFHGGGEGGSEKCRSMETEVQKLKYESEKKAPISV